MVFHLQDVLFIGCHAQKGGILWFSHPQVPSDQSWSLEEGSAADVWDDWDDDLGSFQGIQLDSHMTLMKTRFRSCFLLLS